MKIQIFRFSALMFFAGFIFMNPSVGLADTVLPPCSSKFASKGHRYELVLLAPEPLKEFDCKGFSEARRAEAAELRMKYKVNGVFPIGSNKPNWTVEWYSHEALVTDDGATVIRLGPWPKSIDEEGLALFRNGSLLKSYTIRSLVSRESDLPRSTSHFEWRKGVTLDADEEHATVEALDGTVSVIRVADGELIEQKAPSKEDNHQSSNCAILGLAFASVLIVYLR